jgi:hypothetical protein
LRNACAKFLEYDDAEDGNTGKSIEELTICHQYWTP